MVYTLPAGGLRPTPRPPPMEQTEITTYGIWFALAVIVLREIVPVLIKTIFPGLQDARRRAEERSLAADREERDHRRRLEERQIEAVERLADVSQKQGLLLESMRSVLEMMSLRLDRLEGDTSWIRETVIVLLDRIGERPVSGKRLPTPPPPPRNHYSADTSKVTDPNDIPHSAG